MRNKIWGEKASYGPIRGFTGFTRKYENSLFLIVIKAHILAQI